jgi:hypothetical protein
MERAWNFLSPAPVCGGESYLCGDIVHDEKRGSVTMKIQPVAWVLSLFLSSVLTLGTALSVRAQDDKAPPQQPPAPSAEFDRGQIESFASAALQVREVRSKWQARLQEADNADKAQELQTQASAEMKSAVEEKGLTVDTYNAIAKAAQENPELAERITKLMKESP